jgi:hypothetical protein
VAAPRPRIRQLDVKERLLTAARRVNLPLLAITVGGALFGAYWTVKVSQWVVMSDELQYSKLALNVADTLSPIPVIRGAYTGSFAQLYPILMSPFMRAFDMPTAFRVLHVFNAVLMASTAIPAYLLTREVVRSRAAAYLVAALTVTVPWIVMSTMLLTETAAYPAFAWAILGLQRSLAHPSTRRDLLALGGLAIAFLARTQFLLLVPVFALTVVLHEVGYAAFQERLRPLAAIRTGLRNTYAGHRLLTWTAAATLVVAIPVALAGSAGRVLGRYQTTVSGGDLLPHGILHSFALHLDFVAVGVAILPFVLAAAWALSSVVRPSSKPGHAFAVLLVLTVVAVAFEAASFNLRFALGGPIQDRYVFYVVPMLFVGMVACLLDTRRRSVAVVLAGAGFAWLASLTGYGTSDLPFFASPDSVFHRVLSGKSWDFGQLFGWSLTAKTVIVIATLVMAVAVAVALRRLEPRYTLMAVGLPVLLYCALETNYVFRQVVPFINHGPPTTLKGRDWIDKSVPAGAKVGVVVSPVNSNWDGTPRWFGPGGVEATWLDTEFWNKSIDHVYLYARYGDYAPFETRDVSLNYRSGRLSLPDAPSLFAVSSSDVRFQIASTWSKANRSGLNLMRPAVPHRAVWATRSLPADGWTTAGVPVRLRLYPTGTRSPHRVSVIFQSSTDIKHPRRFRVELGGSSYTATVKKNKSKTAVLSACVPAHSPVDGIARVYGSTDFGWRGHVGLRITRITDRPLAGSCGTTR